MAATPSKVRVGIQTRVLFFALGLALPALILVGWVSINRLQSARDAAISQSEETLLRQAEQALAERSLDKAALYDQIMTAIQRQVLIVHDVAVRAFSTSQAQLPELRIERFWIAGEGIVAVPTEDIRLPVNQAQVVVESLRTQVRSNSLINVGYIGLESGIILFNRPEVTASLPPEYDPRLRDWYTLAVSKKSAVWTDPYVDALTRDLTLTAAVPVTISDRLVGVIGLDVLLSTISSDVLENQDERGVYAFLMTADGKILVRPELTAGTTDWNQAFQGENFFDSPDPIIQEMAAKVREGQSGVIKIQLNGRERYVAFAPMQTTGWVVGMVQPIENVVRPAAEAGAAIDQQQERLRSNLLAILGIMSGALVLLAFGLGRTIIHPLRVLDLGAQRVAAGQLDQHLPVRSNDEIGRLSTSFNAMTAALREKLTELEVNAQQLAAINEVSNDLKRQESLADVLDKIPELLCHKLGFDRAVLYLVNEAQTALEVVSVQFGHGNEDQARQFMAAVHEEPIWLDGHSIEASVVRSRQAVIVDDPLKHPNILRRKQQISHSRSYIQAPIVGREAVLGVISADFYTQGRMVTVQDASLLLNFADMVGLTIENAFSFQNLENLVEQRTSELREALDSAQAADRLKSQFLASVSHELRTPLNAIIGFSTVLIDELGADIDEAQREDLETINNNGRYLLDLINDILDMARIEAGKFTLRREPTAVRPIADGAVDLMRSLMATKPVTIRVDVSPDLPPIDADPTRLRQVIINLLSNALRFTEKGTITIRATRRTLDAPTPVGSHKLGPGDWIIISVQDTGIGMDADAVRNLFQEFRQVHEGARGVTGSGLGLSISRRLVELHEGEMWVDSKLGVGSTFSFAIATAVLTVSTPVPTAPEE